MVVWCSHAYISRLFLQVLDMIQKEIKYLDSKNPGYEKAFVVSRIRYSNVNLL